VKAAAWSVVERGRCDVSGRAPGMCRLWIDEVGTLGDWALVGIKLERGAF
jgi:hypothetical protein